MANENILNPIKKMQERLNRALPQVPQVAGNEALNFALDNFKKGGFQGQVFDKWQQRKDPNKWGAVARPGRALLIDTGRLRRSGHIKILTADGVTLEWSVPYASAHNRHTV